MLPTGLTGGFLGIVAFVLVYGWAILDPGHIAWLLHGDPAQHYLGFAFFRSAPWQWPPGVLPTLGVPVGTGILFTDSIPFAAFFFKLLSPWLPTDFQYFGPWMLLSYALYGFFSARVLVRLGLRGLAVPLATLLLLTSPVLALRAYGHESLMAHWLLLASLECHLARRPLAHWGLLILAVAIHPYWLPMLLPLALVDFWLYRQSGHLLLHLAGGLTLGVTMTAVGYFVPAVGRLSAEGYGHYSANLLTLFDPMDWQGFLRHYGRPLEGSAEWSRFLPSLGQATDGQYEGFAYLGAGVLMLLVYAIFQRGRTGMGAGFASLGWPLIVALFLALYALSTRVTLGVWTLMDPALPPLLANMLGIFRATGRFIWPLALLLPLVACARLASRVDARSLALLMALFLAVQVLDLSPKWGEFGRRFAPGGLAGLPFLQEDGWRQVRCLKNLVVIPAAIDGDRWIAPAVFAARHGMSLNAAYVARGDEVATRRAEAESLSQLRQGNLRGDTVYLLRDVANFSSLAIGPGGMRSWRVGEGILLAAAGTSCDSAIR